MKRGSEGRERGKIRRERKEGRKEKKEKNANHIVKEHIITGAITLHYLGHSYLGHHLFIHTKCH